MLGRSVNPMMLALSVSSKVTPHSCAVSLILLVEAFQFGKFLEAGCTPGRPEIYHQPFSAGVGSPAKLTVQIVQLVMENIICRDRRGHQTQQQGDHQFSMGHHSGFCLDAINIGWRSIWFHLDFTIEMKSEPFEQPDRCLVRTIY
jgi:hypothetical protein